MPSSLSTFSILSSFFIAAGGFFCVIYSLLQAAANKKHETIIFIHAGFFLAIGISILSDGVSRPGTAYLAPALLYVNYPLDYLLPVILYFYIRLLFEDLRLKKGHLLLLLPALIVGIAFLPYYVLPVEVKLMNYPLYASSPVPFSFIVSYVDYGIFIWMFLALLLTLYRTYFYFFSGIRQVRGIFIYLSLSGLLAASLIVSNFTENNVHYKINMLFMVALLISLALMTVRNPDFYLKIRRKSSEIRYARSQVQSLNLEGIMDRIDDLMTLEHLYRDPLLTVEMLSSRLGISRQQLSEIINTRYDQNFKTFVNSCRIEAAKQELTENRESTVITIAMDCGFNSKSTFNKVFQETTGMTPTQWRKEKNG